MKKISTTFILIMLLLIVVSAVGCKSNELLWKYQTDGWVYSVASGNLDSDNKDEVIAVSGGTSKPIVAIDNNGNILWSYTTAVDNSLWHVSAEDVDADQEDEVLVGKHWYGNASWMNVHLPNIFLFDNSGSLRWSYMTEGYATCTTIGDINGDGKKEIIAGGDSKELVYCFNTEGQLLWAASLPYGGEIKYWHALATGDVDNDGSQDIVIGTCTYADWSPPSGNSILILKNDGTKISQYNMSSWVNCVIVGDINGNGDNEIIAGTSDGLYTFGNDGELLWSYPTGTKMGDPRINDIALVDLNNDSLNEIVAASEGFKVYVLNSSGALIWEYMTDYYVREVEIGDVTGDGKEEIVADGFYGIDVIESDGTLYWHYSKSGGNLWGLALGDLNGDGVNDIIVGSEDKNVYAFTLAGSNK